MNVVTPGPFDRSFARFGSVNGSGGGKQIQMPKRRAPLFFLPLRANRVVQTLTPRRL